MLLFIVIIPFLSTKKRANRAIRPLLKNYLFSVLFPIAISVAKFTGKVRIVSAHIEMSMTA